MEAMKKVSQAEFDAFIASYPRPLSKNVLRTCQPEHMQYNDFTLGEWPGSVVASYLAWGGDPKDIYAHVPGDWRIAEVPQDPPAMQPTTGKEE